MQSLSIEAGRRVVGGTSLYLTHSPSLLPILPDSRPRVRLPCKLSLNFYGVMTCLPRPTASVDH